MANKRLIPTICPYCGCGCGFYGVVEGDRVTGIEYMESHPVAGGSLCPKGNAALEVVYHPERVLFPLKKTNGGWEKTPWTDAIASVVQGLNRILSEHGPDSLAFLASAKCSNEENYLLQKLARLMGTNNVDHCARLCHAPSVTGLIFSLGSGAMTNPLRDLAQSRCIFIIGSNLTENHPVVSRWIWEAKDRGAKVIVADPRYTPTGWMADIFLQLKPGTDIALLNAMMWTILHEKLYDRAFIQSRTTGFADLQDFLINRYDPFKMEEITGVPAQVVMEAARLYAKSGPSSIVYCMGITQHTCGHENVLACANLALLCGNVGRPGTGIMPLRGQNNVQGACDMGGLPNFLPGYVRVDNEEGRHRIARAWGAESLPSQSGLTLVEIFEAVLDGKIKGMYIMGENPVISDPVSRHVEEALGKLEFLVVQEMFMSETAEFAHIILPAASWAEKDGTFTATERRVQWMNKLIEPLGEARPDWQIICDVAKGLGLGFNYNTVEEVLEEINTVVPLYGGITPQRLKGLEGGLIWPCPTTDHPGTPILHKDAFRTPDGLAKLFPVEYQPPFEPTDQEYPMILTTGRVVVHYNAGAMTRRSPSLLKRSPELFVEINELDAQGLQIKEGDIVEVETRRGKTKAYARVTNKIGQGVIFMPFHFYGTNILTLAALDKKAKIPEFKVAAARISKG